MNFWTSCGCQMRPIFISQVTWTSRTIVTGQTATLKKFMNALYTAARWRYGVQFRHTGSSDLTFSKMKNGSQWLSLRIGMLICCNLLLHLHWTDFHNFTKPRFPQLHEAPIRILSTNYDKHKRGQWISGQAVDARWGPFSSHRLREQAELSLLGRQQP